MLRGVRRAHGLSALVTAMLLAALAGCRAPDGPRAVPDAGEAAPEPLPSARRPAQRLFFTHETDGCHVVVIEGGTTTPIEATACPLDLALGERIRLAGDVCLREGSPERSLPVVCPGELTSAEHEARRDR
jgi:hypothetical protein